MRPHIEDVVEHILDSDSLREVIKELVEGQLNPETLFYQLDTIRVSTEEFLIETQKEGA